MDNLIEGRIVHFVLPGGAHRAAIVFYVHRLLQGDQSSKPLSSGVCNLLVLCDPATDGKSDIFQVEIKAIFSSDKEPGTWHWIERV